MKKITSFLGGEGVHFQDLPQGTFHQHPALESEKLLDYSLDNVQKKIQTNEASLSLFPEGVLSTPPTVHHL